MRIHHLNCATMCPVASRAVVGHSHMVCHCLLLETAAGLVLVDTGLGLADIERPGERLGRMFPLIVRPKLARDESAIAQVERLGFKASDVRHIVLTHLDPDHAGGLSDFPGAEVHVFETEHAAAMAPASHFERMRYHRAQWAHGPKWVRHRTAGEKWKGFDSVRVLDPRLPEVLLVPLFGHTRGHCGVVIREGEGWLLHAGDAYFHRGEIDSRGPRCPAGIRMYQSLLQVDGRQRLRNQARLRELQNENTGLVRVFCAHDPSELQGFQGVKPTWPAENTAAGP